MNSVVREIIKLAYRINGCLYKYYFTGSLGSFNSNLEKGKVCRQLSRDISPRTDTVGTENWAEKQRSI